MIINIERELLAIVGGLPPGARANGPALLALIEPGMPCPPLDRRLLYYTEIYEELIFGLEWELAGPAPPESEIELVIEWTADAFVDHGGRWEPLVPPVRSVLSDKGVWFPLRYDLRGTRAVAVTLSVRPEALARIMDARIWMLLVAGCSGAPRSRAPVCVPLADGHRRDNLRCRDQAAGGMMPIPARWTGDGRCPCGNPTALLPKGARVNRGGGAHRRLCARCFLEQQTSGIQDHVADEEWARRHSEELEGDDASTDVEAEFEARLEEERKR